MKREGLTFTVIFLAESANYGEGIGNISSLKKMTRGDYEEYSYISRQALRYNMVQQASWDTTPVDGKSGVVQFAPSATIADYPEIDLFGYMKQLLREKIRQVELLREVQLPDSVMPLRWNHFREILNF
jgi:CRISPR-associated protein Cst2